MQLTLMLVLFLVVANLLLTLTLHRDIAMQGPALPKGPGLPCAAIPTRFVAQEPVCAQKLIEAMNVTNVRVLTNASQLGGFDSGMATPLGDVARWKGDAKDRSR